MSMDNDPEHMEAPTDRQLIETHIVDHMSAYLQRFRRKTTQVRVEYSGYHKVYNRHCWLIYCLRFGVNQCIKLYAAIEQREPLTFILGLYSTDNNMNVTRDYRLAISSPDFTKFLDTMSHGILEEMDWNHEVDMKDIHKELADLRNRMKVLEDHVDIKSLEELAAPHV